MFGYSLMETFGHLELTLQKGVISFRIHIPETGACFLYKKEKGTLSFSLVSHIPECGSPVAVDTL
jgi:hypothetical protein